MCPYCCVPVFKLLLELFRLFIGLKSGDCSDEIENTRRGDRSTYQFSEKIGKFGPEFTPLFNSVCWLFTTHLWTSLGWFQMCPYCCVPVAKRTLSPLKFFNDSESEWPNSAGWVTNDSMDPSLPMITSSCLFTLCACMRVFRCSNYLFPHGFPPK